MSEREDHGPDYAAQPELAVVALMAMLARYPFTRCERMSESILAHLRYIAEDRRYAPVLREEAGRLYFEWRFLRASAGVPAPVPESLN